ncbi:type II toxin-antitoxin system Phd/YefM family antitoxin [Methylobacterium sp. Gmos1]
MKSWPIQDAEVRFGEVLDTCLREGPQLVTTEGQDAAVLVPIREWERLQRDARPTLKDLLLAPEPRADLMLPERGSEERRPPILLD